MPPKQRELTHGRFDSSDRITMPVGYDSRPCPADVAVSAVFEADSWQTPAFRDDALESPNFTLVPLLFSSFIEQKAPRRHHLHSGGGEGSQKIDLSSEAHQYAKEN